VEEVTPVSVTKAALLLPVVLAVHPSLVVAVKAAAVLLAVLTAVVVAEILAQVLLAS
jgi:hypothetical protein